jgi:hypothetical protein
MAALAAPGDTTWVRTFDHDFYNWATPHYQTFTFPDDPSMWESIRLFYTIECPDPPNDCDPWDRLGYMRVVTPQGEVEIARIVTPYDITGPNRPGTCTWEINVSPYKALLRGEVELMNYIESWIGGNNGWIVTCDFAFVEGERAWEPYKVVNLFQDDYLLIGDPNDPVENQIPPELVEIDPRAERVKVRVFVTGHGQANTLNCAEFCPLTHTVTANGDDYSRLIWRTDCASNPCSPQGGTWQFSRAGWCPGSDAPAWTSDITSSVTPGETALISYTVQDYVNDCRPDNPECVDGVTCALCAYNGGSHTPPHYTLQSQVVFYKPHDGIVGADPATAADPAEIDLAQNRPNPFLAATEIGYVISRGGPVQLRIHDSAGRLVREVRRAHPRGGSYTWSWDGTDAGGSRVASGAYFYSIHAAGEMISRKMIRVE